MAGYGPKIRRSDVLTPYDRGGDRTRGLRIKSPLLYQLSYPVGQTGDELSGPAYLEGVAQSRHRWV